MRNRKRNKRGGFTLMEILLVAAILVIMATMATVAFRSLGRSATSKLALTEIDSFVEACNFFELNHQRYPTNLQELYTAPNGMSKTQWGGPYMDESKGDIMDPWGSEYKYQADPENDRVIITSAGPDRQAGTDDDVTNINI